MADWVVLAAGLLLLYFGAEWLVRSDRGISALPGSRALDLIMLRVAQHVPL